MVGLGQGAVLSDQQHEHFLSEGFVVLRRLVPAEVVAAAAAALEADDPDPDFDAGAVCNTEQVCRVVAELFGAQYPLGKRRGGYDMPRPYREGGDWPAPVSHVDDAYPTLMPNGWAVGTFVFLTKVRSRGGAFIYFSGSPLRFRQQMARSCQSIKEVAASMRYSGPWNELLVEPGDVLFFQHLMGHCGSDNTADPQTRHALLARWMPEGRVVPGDKDFAQMSTIEKANSARYLQHRYKVDLGVCHTPENGMLTAGLDGFGSVLSYGLLHFGGRAQLLFVTADNPALLRRRSSADLVNWREEDPLGMEVGPLRSLYLHQYGLAAVLAVVDSQGGAQIFSSTDFDRWQPVARLAGARTVTPWYIYENYPSKIAGGQALYLVPQGSPDRVLCRWGEDWAAAAAGTRESVALQGAPGSCIDDLVIAARYGDSDCAVVADVRPEGQKAALPHYVLPEDVAAAGGALHKLSFEGEAPPRLLRIFNRGPSYWLVTFLRHQGGEDRLFWGCIDWAEAAPTLRPLSDGAALDGAKAIVGMI